MAPTKNRPAYVHHRPTGQARVRLAGKDFYLGKFGTPESREKYEELVTAWLSNQDPRHVALTVDDHLGRMDFDLATSRQIPRGWRHSGRSHVQSTCTFRRSLEVNRITCAR